MGIDAHTRQRFILSHDENETERTGLYRAGGGERVPIFLSFSAAEKERTIDLRPFMDASPILVSELTPFARVYRMFNEIGVRRLHSLRNAPFSFQTMDLHHVLTSPF
jgi:hypothetical protein